MHLIIQTAVNVSKDQNLKVARMQPIATDTRKFVANYTPIPIAICFHWYSKEHTTLSVLMFFCHLVSGKSRRFMNRECPNDTGPVCYILHRAREFLSFPKQRKHTLTDSALFTINSHGLNPRNQKANGRKPLSMPHITIYWQAETKTG